MTENELAHLKVIVVDDDPVSDLNSSACSRLVRGRSGGRSN